MGKVVISHALLAAIHTGFKTTFQGAFGPVTPQWSQIASLVPSDGSSETYGWLGKLPKMREWVGDRVVHDLAASDYQIKNRSFEVTVGVDRDDIEDDKLGVFKPVFEDLGQSAAEHPDDLVFGALAAGMTTPCYDGQNFFDDEHPGWDEDGDEIVVSNVTAGAKSRPWVLLDCSRAVKPLIFQQRKKPEFVAMTSLTDELVFSRKEFRWGVDSRGNVGFGFWQMAHAGFVDLNPDTFKAARQTMKARRGENGRHLKLKPTHLVVNSEDFNAAEEMILTETLAGGGKNPLYRQVEVVEASQLDS